MLADTWCNPIAYTLQAYIILNLTADLRSEFTWNTKQIFAYVNIEFETAKNKENQMVMWSAIIQKPVRGAVVAVRRWGYVAAEAKTPGRGCSIYGRNPWCILSAEPFELIC